MDPPSTADTLHHPFGQFSLHNNVQGLGRSVKGACRKEPVLILNKLMKYHAKKSAKQILIHQESTRVLQNLHELTCIKLCVFSPLPSPLPLPANKCG